MTNPGSAEIARLYFSTPDAGEHPAPGLVVCISSWELPLLCFEDVASTISSWGIPTSVMGGRAGSGAGESGMTLWPASVDTLREWPGSPGAYFVAISCADPEAFVAGYELARSVSTHITTGIWLWAESRPCLVRAIEGFRSLWNEHGGSTPLALSGACGSVHESSARSILRICGLSERAGAVQGKAPADPSCGGSSVDVVHVDRPATGRISVLHASTPSMELCEYARTFSPEVRIVQEGSDLNILLPGRKLCTIISLADLKTVHVGEEAMILTNATLPDACLWLSRLAGEADAAIGVRALWAPLSSAELAGAAALSRRIHAQT